MSIHPGSERRTFDATASSSRAARQFAAGVLTERGAPRPLVRDVMLVVSELITNFVEHSRGDRIEVIFQLDDPRWWQVEVAGGAALADKRLSDPSTWTVAAADDISGRGLGIVRQLMDVVEIAADGDRISVRCRVARDRAT